MAIRLQNTYGDVDGYLSSPLSSNLITYTSSPVPVPVSAPRSTVLPAVSKANTEANTLTTAIENTPAPSQSGIEALVGLNQSTALTGLPNSPATPSGANIPGLDNQTTKGMMQIGGIEMHWGWIVLIAAIILGLLWWSRNSSSSAA